MITYLIQGIVLGFVSGISPGPLLGLLISQTIRCGWRAGIRVALAPLLTDIPMILLFVFVLGHLPAVALHSISIVGGLFVIYLGYKTVQNGRKGGTELAGKTQERSGHVLLTAVMTNLLNPHPYIFWATVGSTIMLQAFARYGIGVPTGFLTSFYVLLVGMKIVMVFLLNWGRNWLQGGAYHAILMVSGLLLAGLGVWLLWEGWQAFFH